MSGEKIPTAFGMVTPAFTPDRWREGLVQAWAEHTEHMIRLSYIRQGIDPDNKPTIQVKEPLPAEFLAAREEYRERYEAILAEGEEKGFLDFGPDGDQWVKTDVDRWATIPNPDYDPDRPNPYATPPATGDPE